MSKEFNNINDKLVLNTITIYVIRFKPKLEILVLHRSDKHLSEGTAWQVVFGSLEDQESYKDAALRELYEELSVQPLQLYNMITLDIYYDDTFDKVVVSPVFVAVINPDQVVTLSEEHNSYKWIVANEISKFLFGRQKCFAESIHFHFSGKDRLMKEISI